MPTDPRDVQVTGAITQPDVAPPPGSAPPETLESPVPPGPVPPAGTSQAPLTRLGQRAHRVADGARRAAEAVPLRTRLVAILVALLAGALMVSGGIVINRQRADLMDDLDHRLDRAAGPMAEAATNNGFVDRGRGPFTSDFVAFVLLDDGTPGTLHRPPVSNLPDADPDFSKVAQESPGPKVPFTLGSTTGSTRWRTVMLPLQLISTGEVVGAVYVATPMTQVDSTLQALTVSLAAVAVMVTAVGAVLGWMLVRRSFRPLVEMEETAAAIAAGDLSRRIPPHPPTTEVGRLTASLNGMLAQIESAFHAREASEARTRRFAADASHELRTPLVSIRGFAELYRQGAVPPDEVPRTMRRIEDEAKRMGSLVEDLLLLARLDEQRPGRKDPVDLTVLAGDAVHDARGLDCERRVTLAGLGTAGPAPAVVIGDEDRLRQVVANLVANAVRHTPAGTPIEIAVGMTGPDGMPGPRSGPDGRHAVLEVRDHGRGLTAEQAQRVFERFYRVDSSRRRGNGGGSGLGLSIVAAVVTSHAGRVEVLETPGGGATFRILLPAAPPPAGRGETVSQGRPGASGPFPTVGR